jgi:tRNA(Ile)-lysidine synthase
MAEPIVLKRAHLRAGMRVALAVSGGADSVALLRAALLLAAELGLVVSVVHVHHGIRGEAADEDAAFVEALAAEYRLFFYLHRVDTPAHARQHRQSLEEAARDLRYSIFRGLLEQDSADAVLTAHTLDDQAETVLLKLLRGSWTEGLGGVYPMVTCSRGVILRPLLETRRTEIEAWLRELGQPWREDATNLDTTFTRNRVRHQLLPELESYNPQIAATLARMAELAREEESYWRQEMDRLLPTLLLPGRAVRGGGRAVSTQPEKASLGIELERLRALAPAVRRRAVREAARRIGVSLDFEQVARLMAMIEPESMKSAPRREQLTAQLHAERTARELRLILKSAKSEVDGLRASDKSDVEPVEIPVPGAWNYAVYGLRVRVEARVLGGGSDAAKVGDASVQKLEPLVLRFPKPGDRVRLRYTSGKKPLKEVFARLRLDASKRSTWPLIVWRDEVVWMKDVVLEPDPHLPFTLEVTPLEDGVR